MATETLSPPATETANAQPAAAPKVNRPGFYDEAFAGLDELERAPASAPKPKEPAKPEPKAKPQAEKPAAPTDPANGKPPAGKVTDKPAEVPAKPAEVKKESPEATAAELEDDTKQFKTAHDLRKDWRRLKTLAEERERELSELRVKAESSKKTPDPVILEENKTLKKRLEEVETELRYVDFTKSQEFRDKFEKPYQDAYDDAIEEVKEFQVLTPDGGVRPATAQDFQRILQADTTEVRKLASDLFGESANDVLVMRRRLIEMNRNAQREAKRYREEAGKREQEKAIKAAEQQEGLKKLWESHSAAIAEKYPDYFAHIEGDDEYNKELDAGYATVDKAQDPKIPVTEKVERLAALRHRAAAFRAQVLVNRRLKARVAELEEVVKGYEESAPKAGKGGSEASRVSTEGDSMPSAFDELDAIDARSSVHP